MCLQKLQGIAVSLVCFDSTNRPCRHQPLCNDAEMLVVELSLAEQVATYRFMFELDRIAPLIPTRHDCIADVAHLSSVAHPAGSAAGGVAVGSALRVWDGPAVVCWICIAFRQRCLTSECSCPEDGFACCLGIYCCREPGSCSRCLS